MKLLSLNTWGGKLFDPLISYLGEKKKEIDIFCLQEVFSNKEGIEETHEYRANLLQELQKALTEYKFAFFSNINRMDINGDVDFDLEFGMAIFWKKELEVIKSGQIRIVDFPRPKDLSREDISQSLIFIEMLLSGKKLFISSFHGVAYPGSKMDTPTRLEQSKKIIEFLNSTGGEKILCGDFNLYPDTESIAIIENSGMKNLIEEFDIKDTRGPINQMLYREKGYPIQCFADFTFTSSGVGLKNFEVPQIGISDHLPMILEFELI
jgi:endonuclease/exonuclease/phosphatase family metal-dependent hydrolase